MLELLDYPIVLSKENFMNLSGEKTVESSVLNMAHEIIYDFLIYPTFNEDIKNRIIERYKDKLEKPILKALYQQSLYLLTNGGDISKWNGIINNGGTVDKTEVQEIATKTICIQAINILMGAPINILYSGG